MYDRIKIYKYTDIFKIYKYINISKIYMCKLIDFKQSPGGCIKTLKHDCICKDIGECLKL